MITNLSFLVANTKREKVWISHTKKKVPPEGILEETSSSAVFPGDTGSLDGRHLWNVSFLSEKSVHTNTLET